MPRNRTRNYTFATRVCLRCAEPFTREAYLMKRRDSKYCSRRCAVRARHDGHVQAGVMRECLTCGRVFHVWPSGLKTPGRTTEYCSNTCKGLRIGEIRKGKHLSPEARAKIAAAATGRKSSLRKPPTQVSCAGCLRVFEIPGRKHYLLAQTRFCGTKCWYAHLREHPESNPRFKGGREPYYGPDWNEQARRARERDGYTCQDCGLRQKRPLLDVHHLIPRRAFAGDHGEANRLENLVTLCKVCHSRRESVLVRLAAPE